MSIILHPIKANCNLYIQVRGTGYSLNGNSPLLRTESRIVFGMDTNDTLATVFFFFGFSSTYLDVDLERCFLLPEPGTDDALLSGSSLNGEFFLEDSLANVIKTKVYDEVNIIKFSKWAEFAFQSRSDGNQI